MQSTSLRILSRRERWLSVVVATVTSASVLSGAVMLFADDGRTPWFAPNTELAQAAERCDSTRSSSLRHQCLRNVAAARTQEHVASAPIAVATTYP